MPFARASFATSIPSMDRGTLSGSECTWMSMVPRSTWTALSAVVGCRPRISPVGVATAVAAANIAVLTALAKRVEKLYKLAGCTQPNDLQFVADGLWVLDQVDPNKAFKVRPEDGSIIEKIQTESIHGSGITYGNGALWITSTKMTDPAMRPR